MTTYMVWLRKEDIRRWDIGGYHGLGTGGATAELQIFGLCRDFAFPPKERIPDGFAD